MESSPKKVKTDYTLGLVGARTMTDYALFSSFVNNYVGKVGALPSKVVSGGARGADSLARQWAKEKDVPLVEFIPEWKKLGKKAGIVRNTDIVNACDVLIAFPSKEGRGTQDSIRKAEKDGKEVIVNWDWKKKD